MTRKIRRVIEYAICPRCQGQGDWFSCHICEGKGKIIKREEITEETTQ